MTSEIEILAVSAVTIGFLHTILGPDHYIPFIAMSKAGNWSMLKTIVVTVLSGIGHVLSSIVLGMIGVGLGLALNILEDIESIRGDIASWLLISFGLIYFIWGMRRSYKNRSHTHAHKHSNGIIHSHGHSHTSGHTHVHENDKPVNLTPWIIFTIFVFGPCEALIPVLMYPASSISFWGMAIVTALFAVSTIITMLGVVILSVYGINFIPLNKFEKYSHAAAGLIIFLSGVSVQFLGL